MHIQFHLFDSFSISITSLIQHSLFVLILQHKFSKSQYFVCPPLFWMTAARRRGMLLTRLAQYSFDISFTRTSFMTRQRSGRLEGCFSATLSFITVHKFSIGLRSGLFQGQSKTFTFFFFRKFVTNFDLWHGVPTCKNIVHLWTCMCS